MQEERTVFWSEASEDVFCDRGVRGSNQADTERAWIKEDKEEEISSRNDLRAEKAKYRAVSKYQADTKHLYDISRYWSQMKRLGLPEYQYTIRDVKSGSMVLGYRRECTEEIC